MPNFNINLGFMQIIRVGNLTFFNFRNSSFMRIDGGRWIKGHRVE
jgi:hypothetical protein